MMMMMILMMKMMRKSMIRDDSSRIETGKNGYCSTDAMSEAKIIKELIISIYYNMI